MRSFLSWAAALSCLLLPSLLWGQRSDICLREGWEFWLEGQDTWTQVRVPHDWAITGPFDRGNDLNVVRIVENGETVARPQTGRTGGLPYVGTGHYRIHFDVPDGKRAILLFDGAMSNAAVSVNGREVASWPNGYNAFSCDITDAVHAGDNLLEVSLTNLGNSSRWYPGAGLYRNVHLILADEVHIPVWGVRVYTPTVREDIATVALETSVAGVTDGDVRIVSRVTDRRGGVVAVADNVFRVHDDIPCTQRLRVDNPELWSPESPALYHVETEIWRDGRLCDTVRNPLGFRTIEFVPGVGMLLNGVHRQFKGVCNHHDLGPLGAAVNRSAIAHRLGMLKDMGCDAIRTTHNMPSPELVDLCDSLGFMLVVEAFDEWHTAKCRNGYHLYFDEWAERDITNMVRHFRNHPSVVMWSIGNEVPDQWTGIGSSIAKTLQDICHREDPTRNVTCGMNHIPKVIDNGFAAVLDVPGFNYHLTFYDDGFARLPQGYILGSETASTVSSRGVYKAPLRREDGGIVHPDHQSSAYEVEPVPWGNTPEGDFSLADRDGRYLGQFVWTGFDYLGEPYPYSIDSWPNHSSCFGIIDLASIPKDRYWLYRSVWNVSSPTLHLLPHWNWTAGERVPVMTFSSWPEAELFVNGVSQGRRGKDGGYRIVWEDVRFEPGELKVVAHDSGGAAVDSMCVRTAGTPYKIELRASADTLKTVADGDLAYVYVSVTDRDGNLCPHDGRVVSFEVSGQGRFRAAANGDPTSLDSFVEQHMHLFGGMCSLIVEAGNEPGVAEVHVKAKGLKSGKIKITVI